MKKEIVIGIIGAGRIGRLHAESIVTGIPNVRIKTISDVCMNDEMKEWSNTIGVENTTKEAEAIFSDPEIEAVLICSSTDTHADFAKSAAMTGKHIFCEKPLDLDIKRIKDTLDIVEKSGVKFQIGFNRRFDHNFMALRRAVEEDIIGNQHIIKITSRDPEPPNPEYIDRSGGMFMDMTIHDFDMVRFLSGSEVESIFVQGAVLVDPEIGKAGDIDTALITMKLKNGALAVIDNSRRAVYGYDQRAEIFGDKGAVSSKNDAMSTVVTSTKDGVIGEKPLFFFLERYMDSFRLEMKQFISAVKNDKEVKVGAIDALKSVQIAMAAKESLEKGVPVVIE